MTDLTRSTSITLRSTAAAALAVLLAVSSAASPAVPVPSSGQITPLPRASRNPVALTPDERVLHVLNRFTFGPTLQSIAAVYAAAPAARHGKPAKSSLTSVDAAIDAWFELQLHPGRLTQAPSQQLLSARLAAFPAIELPVNQLLENFPANNEIRQAANGNRPLPSDPALAAIYRRQIALYNEKQEKKAESRIPQAAMASPAPAAPASIAAPDSYPEDRVTALLNLPPAERVNTLMALPLPEYDRFRTALKAPRKVQLTRDLSPAQRELLEDYDNPTRTVVQEFQAQRLLRDIYSESQLQEVMTTFWLNHFNIYLHKNAETPYYMTSYERDVVRPRALGNFEDLLVATALSPAMLVYLDNATSTGPDSAAARKQKDKIAAGKTPPRKKTNSAGLNENYARELMELHTLGVNGGYSQADVTEVAKVFSGWTVSPNSPISSKSQLDRPNQPANSFVFDQTRHEPGPKQVLGHTFKENGQAEGLELLHLLATSPATARFISTELATQFVSDNPPATLVNRMARTFLQTHGDIASVLRTLLHSPEFWAPANLQAKVKTPLEYVVSAARASGADVTNAQPLVSQLNQMGMPLYACIPPTGYSSKADAWVSTGALVARMNFALSLATNHYQGIHIDWSQLAPQSPDLIAAEKLLETTLVPTGISEKTRAAVLNQAQDNPLPVPPAITRPATMPLTSRAPGKPGQASQTDQLSARLAGFAGLLLGSPEFQRR